MEILLRRRHFTDRATEGELYIRQCVTLEDRVRPSGEKVYGETAIPPGRYRLALRDSPKFGKDVLWLRDVPGFEWIYIHGGNKPEDTLGCILVGLDPTRSDDAWIGQSQAALVALREKVVPRLKAGEEVWITIEEPSRAFPS